MLSIELNNHGCMLFFGDRAILEQNVQQVLINGMGLDRRNNERRGNGGDERCRSQ